MIGRRRAEVDAARAARNTANAEAELTRLDVAIGAVNAYLTLLAAERTVQAAQADVERREVLAKSVRVLVDNQLRPGADASRANAEWARARANLARARQQREIRRAALADILAVADGNVDAREDSLVSTLPPGSPSEKGVTAHPLAAAQQSRVDEAGSAARTLERSYYPKFNFQSAVYGRGSGANADGTFGGGTGGLGPDRSNWAVGLTITFPLLDVFSIRQRKAIEAANERGQEARHRQTILDLTAELRKAQASLDGARQVAEATPVELDTARMRFDAGSVPVGYLVFSSATRSVGEIQDAALNRVRPLFATLPGVSAPPPFGGAARTIVVSVDPDRLPAYRMAPEEVIQALTLGTPSSQPGMYEQVICCVWRRLTPWCPT